MKDLGDVKKLNIDSNQKRVKDETKPMTFYSDLSPADVTRNSFKKIKSKLKKEKKK